MQSRRGSRHGSSWTCAWDDLTPWRPAWLRPPAGAAAPADANFVTAACSDHRVGAPGLLFRAPLPAPARPAAAKNTLCAAELWLRTRATRSQSTPPGPEPFKATPTTHRCPCNAARPSTVRRALLSASSQIDRSTSPSVRIPFRYIALITHLRSQLCQRVSTPRIAMSYLRAPPDVPRTR